jgi:hypothetical protein
MMRYLRTYEGFGDLYLNDLNVGDILYLEDVSKYAIVLKIINKYKIILFMLNSDLKASDDGPIMPSIGMIIGSKVDFGVEQLANFCIEMDSIDNLNLGYFLNYKEYHYKDVDFIASDFRKMVTNVYNIWKDRYPDLDMYIQSRNYNL